MKWFSFLKDLDDCFGGASLCFNVFMIFEDVIEYVKI